MSETLKSPSNTAQIKVAGFAFLIPFLLVVAFLIALLFAPILGVQATEIVKLIQEAEISLTGFLSGGSDGKDFFALLPKIAIFNVLLIIWLATAVLMTLVLTQALSSVRLRFGLAATVAVSVPAILLVKYWTANPDPAGPSSPVLFGDPRTWAGLIPKVEPGGFWIFSLIMILEIVLVLWLLGRRALEREGSWPRQTYLHILFAGSVLIFAVVSILFMVGPPLLASQLGTINISLIYILFLYNFVAGLVCYLRTSVGIKVLGAVAAYLIILHVAAPFLVKPEAESSRDAQRNRLPRNQFTAWINNRIEGATADKPYPVFLVAASGGGLRASMRTVFFLEYLRVNCPVLLRHTFAISSVSGGALGSLLFVAQQQALDPVPDKGCDLLPSNLLTALDAEKSMERQAPLLDSFFATDAISALVGAGLFSEVFQRFLPPGLVAKFDRSIAFNNVLAARWREIVEAAGVRASSDGGCKLKEFLTLCDSNSYWSPEGNAPLLIFNATSATDGGLVPLTNVDPTLVGEYAPAPLFDGVEAGSSPTFRFVLLSGASASARFPLALPAAVLTDIGGRQHTLVDGGYFDNSGLVVARTVKHKIESIIRSESTANGSLAKNVKVYILYLADIDQNRVACENVNALMGTSGEEAPSINAELAHANALLLARDRRSVMTLKLIMEADPDKSIIEFDWDSYNPPVPYNNDTGEAARRPKVSDCREAYPLAFYYAPETRSQYRRVLEDQLLKWNSTSLKTLQSLMEPYVHH